MALPTNLRVGTQFPFPSLVTGAGPMTLTKTNGIWKLGFSINSLGSQNPTSYANNYVLGYDSLAQAFFSTSVLNLQTGVGPLAPARTQRSLTTEPITIASTDQILNCNFTVDPTIQLPPASTRLGQPLTFNEVGGRNVIYTFLPNGSDTIDGVNGPMIGITRAFGWITFVPFNDGINSGWFGPAFPFSPNDLPGMLLWLKADAGVFSDAGVTAAADGQSVAQWNNQANQSSWRYTANRARWNYSNNTTLNQTIMARSGHKSFSPITSLKVILQNVYVATLNGTGEAGLGSPATVKASVEYPAGVFTQIKFGGGGVTGTIPDASVLLSDEITIPGGIPANTIFWVRQFWSNPAGMIFNNGVQDIATYGDAFTSGNTGVVVDQTMSGTITDNASGNSLSPAAILTYTNYPAIAIVGDSVGAGIVGTGGGATVTGEAAPYLGDVGLVAKSIAATTPFCNMSVAGTQANYTKGASYWGNAAAARRTLLPYCSHVICELGVNDYQVGDLAPAIKFSLQVLYTSQDVNAPGVVRPGLPVFGLPNGTPIIQTTITPKSTSTDGFLTTVNQTPFVNNAERVTLNNVIRAVGLSGQAGFIETAHVLETTPDSSLWTVTPTPPYTTDGLHPDAAGYALVSASGNVKLPSIRNAVQDLSSTFAKPVYRASVNGRPAIQWSHGTSGLFCGARGDFNWPAFTVFMVVQKTDFSGITQVGLCLADPSSNSNSVWQFNMGTTTPVATFDTFHGATKNSDCTVTFVGSTDFVLAGRRVDNSTKTAYLNNALASSGGDGNNAFNIWTTPVLGIGNAGTTGTNEALVGYIREVLYYARALSDFEVAKVQSYLVSRWGIS